MSGRDTHAGVWSCKAPECGWAVVISGSFEYVGGDMAARLAFLQVLAHDVAEHWPSKLQTEFIKDGTCMVDPDRIVELAPPSRELVAAE